MREVIFIKRNKDKWTQYEQVLQKKIPLNPADLTTIYLDLTDDLSYAKSYYPNSQLTIYLNELASLAHRRIYKTKKESGNAIKRFYGHDFPLFFYSYRPYLLGSFLIFLLFVLIGWFSVEQNADFTRWLLGDAYVDMTLDNIQKGDPMAIYKQANEVDMFLGITINNIKVAIYTFVMGILFGIGTLYYLMHNALMLGAFQNFFFQKDLGWASVRSIWLHGTIEISVIIVAGAAGFILASGLLIPGTYTRIEAFRQKARAGLKVMISTIPFFIIAGFLEGFITRHTEMPDWLAITIIFSSLSLIVYYYIILPAKLHRKNQSA